MPYVDIQTIHNPTTGQVAPASWGDGARDALQYLSGGFPHCSILESTAQSVADSTPTDLTSNEENSDIGGMHSTSSNTDRLVVPASEGGLYLVRATVEFASNGTGYRGLTFRKNNTTDYNIDTRLTVNVGGAATILTGVRGFVLAAGDYMTCRVFQTSTGALNVTMREFGMEWRATS